MKITIFCSDRNHPVFPYIHGWEKENSSKHEIHLTNNINEIKNGDLLFLIAVTQIVKSDIRNRFKKTLCVHESDLPEGRGWSPVVYAVLNNEKKISMSLFEVNDGIDSGDIWKKIFFNIEKHEIASEINHKVSIKTIELMNFAIENFNDIKPIPQDDSNITTYLERRTPDDSQLDVGKTIAEQFNQIRIADRNRYPCFFYHNDHQYKLIIEKHENDKVKNKTKRIIKFRQVEANDWNFILDLRNKFHNNFEQQNSPLSRDEHVRYMEKQIQNPNFEQWIIQDDENQNEIGYIRVLDDDISILLKTEFQGMGYGKEILLQLDQQVKSSKKLVAKVLSHNISSIKAFEKTGYKLKMLIYEKDIT